MGRRAYTRMREIGDWMKINGVAIYKSRPIYPYKSGKVCFTSVSGEAIYDIYLAEADETTMPATIQVNGIKLAKGSTVGLLGYNGTLKWKQEQGSAILIIIPPALQKKPPCRHAWTFRFSGQS